MVFLLFVIGLLSRSAGETGADCPNADGQWYFTVNPKSTSVTQGDRVYLDCEVNDPCDLTVHWEYGGQPVVNDSRRYQVGSALVIERVLRELDSKHTWRCIGRHVDTGQAQHSSAAELEVLWISENATVESIDGSGSVMADSVVPVQEARLRCSVEGSGDMRFQWFRNGKRLQVEDPTTPDLYMDELHLPDRLGVYTCRVSNDAGERLATNAFAITKANDATGVLHLHSAPSSMLLAIPNTPLHLHCPNGDGSDVVWTSADGTDLSQHGSLLADGSLLLDRVDEGWVHCTAANITSVFHVRVASLPVFDAARDFVPRARGVDFTRTAALHENYELWCLAPLGSYPTPDVFWSMDDDSPVPRTGRIRQFSGAEMLAAYGDDASAVLRIDAVAEGDAGVYRCTARNQAGEQQAAMSVDTSVAPRLLRHPSSKVVEEGSTVELRCSYEGDEWPKTVVRWMKNGVTILSNDHLDSEMSVDERTGVLSIGYAAAHHSGDYRCVVLTAGQAEVVSKTATIDVIEALKFSPTPTDTAMEIGKPGKVACRARGAEPPVVHWIKTASILRNGSVVPHDAVRTSTNGTLQFDSVDWDAQGMYDCIARSDTQGVITTTVRVDVYDGPYFTSRPSNKYVLRGQRVYLHCSASGQPAPSIHWDRDGDYNWATDILPRDPQFRLFPNHTLLIRNVSRLHAGEYGCGAGTPFSLDRQVSQICVRDSSKSNTTYCGPAIGYRAPGSFILPGEHDAVPLSTIAIALGSAIGYLVFMFAIGTYCRCRRRAARKAQQSAQHFLNGANGSHGPSLRLLDDSGATAPALTPLDCTLNSSLAGQHVSLTPVQRPATVQQLQYDRAKLRPLSRLGSGVYGEVQLMKAPAINLPELESTVVVKMLQTKDEGLLGQMTEEIDMFFKLQHPNIASLLAVCREEQPVLVISQYLEWGNLKHYLLASRHYGATQLPGVTYPPPLTETQMLDISYQVSCGMQYLDSHRFVHRDLAARNILLSSQLTAKITSLSLSKDAFSDEYCTFRQCVLPLRWLPAEAFFDDEWSMKSDVWALGVLAWELFGHGTLPYEDCSNEAVIALLRSGELSLDWSRLPAPFRTVLASCTKHDVRHRPSYDAILESILDTRALITDTTRV